MKPIAVRGRAARGLVERARLPFNARSCEKTVMADRGGTQRKRGPIALAELVGKALDPLTAHRGFATAELTAGWADIVGSRYADCSRPEKIVWPRGAENDRNTGLLIVRVDGPRALLFQHEIGQVIERVNAFIGHGAIGKIRILQGPVEARQEPEKPTPGPLDPEGEESLAAALSGVDSENLRAALDRLGRAVLSGRDKKS